MDIRLLLRNTYLMAYSQIVFGIYSYVPVIFYFATTFHHEERSSRIFVGTWKIILVSHFLTHVVTEKSKPLYC